jgi:hypothetical protein
MEADVQPSREAVVEVRQPVGDVEEVSGQWEAPSFLRRPATAVEETAEEPVVEKRTRMPRRPRAAAAETVLPSDDTPESE